MRLSKMRGLIVLTFTMSALTGCGGKQTDDPGRRPSEVIVPPAQKVQDKARDMLVATKDFFGGQKDELQRRLTGKMSGFDKQLDAFKEKSRRAGDKAKSAWSDTIAQLEKKKENASHKLYRLKSAGTNVWSEVRSGAESAFADLENAFNAAAARFKDDEKPAQ